METRRLKRDIEALLVQYIGQNLRENAFDPRGKDTSSLLDDLAHCDLSVALALWWLDRNGEKSTFEQEFIQAISDGPRPCPYRLEREAVILSSFAGMLLNSLPVDEIMSMYNHKPTATCLHPDTKSNIVHPFSLSYHPFAMLNSFKAVDHSRKHTQNLTRWNALHKKASTRQKKLKPPSSTPSSQFFFSDSEDSSNEETKNSESSQESQQD